MPLTCDMALANIIGMQGQQKFGQQHGTQPAPLMPVEPGSKQQQHGTGLQHGVKKPLPQVVSLDDSLATAAMASYCARTRVPREIKSVSVWRQGGAKRRPDFSLARSCALACAM